MSVHNRNIRDSVRQLANTFNKSYLKVQVCNVDAVNESDYTCDCTPISGNEDTQIAGVLLNSEANAGFTLIPSIGSTVIVGVSDFDNLPFVMMFEEISKVLITVGDSTLEITNGLFKFNGGSNGGMILINSMVDRMNKVENLVNDIISKYNAHTHPYINVATPANTSPTTSTETTTLTPTVKSDIENTAITQ